VQGIIGQLKKKAIAIDAVNPLPLNKLRKIKKAAVIVQSTQNYDRVTKIIGIMKKEIKQLKSFNTICNPTRLKQQEIKKLPKRNDIMIIIGSKHSANTKRLYQISKSLNKKSYWVQTYKGLKKEWFKKVKNVGIAAGSSTPDKTTRSVIDFINNLK